MKKLQLILLSLALSFLFFSPQSFSDSPRMVLIEEATNTSCGPCATQNPSFQKFIKDNFDKVIPITYHAWWPGSDDPMYLENVAMNEGRIRYYNIHQMGVPNVRVNGKIAPKTGSWYDGAAGDINALTAELAKYQNATSPISISIAETRNGNQCSVKVTVQSTQAISNKKLRVAVLEYFISYPQAPGLNGEKEFWWVARTMLPDHNGTTINQDANRSQDYNFNFTIKSTWKASQIYIVAFIQDDDTKEVLQAATNLKLSKVLAESDNRYLTIPRNSTITSEIRLTNPMNELARVAIEFDNESSYIPNNWTASASANEVNLTPNESKSVKINIKSGSKAEFAIISFKVYPKVNNPYEATTISLYVLTEGTRYAFYTISTGTTASSLFAYQAILNQAKYGNDAALLPFASDILSNYSSSQFDVAVFGFNFFARGILGGYFVESPQLFSNLNSMISAGKSILLTSEVDLSFSLGTQGSVQARDFFNNKIFVNKATEPILRVSVNSQGQITAVNPYSAKGFANDSIGNGLSFTFNQYNQNTHPYYIVYTDILQITNPSKTKAFLYYDNDQSKVGGVRTINGNARIVFLTSGFEAIADAPARDNFVKRIFDWLLAKTPQKLGPQITFSTTSVDFGEVPVGAQQIEDIQISNTGDEDLVITKIEVDRDFDPDGVFSIVNPPSLPLTLKPNGKYTLQVKFQPNEESTYFTSIVVESNANNTPQELISLDGIGVAGAVPVISSNKTEINFGEVELQSSVFQDVDIKNTGLGDLEITTIELVNNSQNAFSMINNPTLPLTLGPQEATTISLMFTPQNEQEYNAILRITSNASNQQILDIPLMGKGKVPGLVDEAMFTNGTVVKLGANPVESILSLNFISTKPITQNAYIQIIDLKGTIVKEISSFGLQNATEQHSFDIGELAIGLYQMKIIIGNETRTISFIKVK